jgi:hypothetical protein
MTMHKEALIAQRAYEIWEKAGRPHGLDREHWYQATAEIELEEPTRNGEAPVHASPSAVVSGDAPVHVSASSVLSGDAPVHGMAATPPQPRKVATTAPAKMKAPVAVKAVPAARTVAAKTKSPPKK